jgi:hypothetical protein
MKIQLNGSDLRTLEIQAESQMVLDSVMDKRSRDAITSGRDTGPGV